MHQFRNLQPLDTMERITRQKLCNSFDNVLNRVGMEDMGFVILDDEGKDRYVLCPAHWMDYCFDDDFGCIINGALRYSINRHTYMPGVVVDFIRKYINVLDTKTISFPATFRRCRSQALKSHLISEREQPKKSS